GAVGLLVPSMRRRTGDAWVLPAWFAAALVFWTLVPNRQLRYLMPAVTPLAILAMSPWPRSVKAAVCAVALASAWNYPRGLLPSLDVDVALPLTLFTVEKPQGGGWPLAEILRAAQGMRQPGPPFSDLAFVANHPSLNGPTLNWERKRLGLAGLRIRGVTKRTTELSEFVLVKTGSLGPDSVTGQLPDVQKVMLDPTRWFQRGWREARRWPLPDGTSAVLFQRRRLKEPPDPSRSEHLDYYEEGSFKAEGMDIAFGRWDPSQGDYPDVSVRARGLTLRGLAVTGVDVGLRDLAFISADESQQKHPDPLSEPRFTRLDGVRLRRAAVSADALAAFITACVKGITDVAVTMDGGVVSARGKWRGVPVALSLAPRVLPEGKGLEVETREAAVAGVPLPVGLLGARRFVLPFKPTGELPFTLSVGPLKVDGGRLTVGG
ncbi:MAG: hypothetical protein KGL53_12070, partial [Elusimicrobia bacterium]|nr:hypothetical protein [Elusimicrobiota bacterium]